jgi:hypothetical protein
LCRRKGRMPLTNQKIEQFKRSVQLALNQEWPELAKIRRRLASIAPRPIDRDTRTDLPVVATVATDGGENRIVLDPIRLHVIRVASSAGEIFCEDFVPLSLKPEEILRFFIQSNVRLQRFLNFLQLDWRELAPSDSFRVTNLLQILRELMEWAALMRLAFDPKPKLLLRDGLLRSVILPDSIFQAVKARFQELTARHGHILAGVSQRSQIVNYLSTSLSLEYLPEKETLFYLPIPHDLEQAAAPPAYRWAQERAMGSLFLARLDEGQQVPFMPVDLAAWQADRIDQAMVLLAQNSRASFPVRGYPQALIEADRYARIGGLECELLERLVLEDLAERNPNVARKAREQMLLGRRLVQSFGHETGDI